LIEVLIDECDGEESISILVLLLRDVVLLKTSKARIESGRTTGERRRRNSETLYRYLTGLLERAIDML
jgi:hypothetical protein